MSLDGIGPLFAVLWVAAHHTHLINQGSASGLFFGAAPVTNVWHWALIVTGAVVLHRPASGHRLLLFAAAGVTAVAVQMPFLANHWYLAGIVNGGLLVAGWRVWRAGRPLTTDRLVTVAAPFIRLALLLAYSAAALAKLNDTFLDPEFSCALPLAHDVASFWGLSLPTTAPVDTAVIALAAGTELMVPILLLIRRTRPVGIAVAALFHFGMGNTPLLPVIDFTAILFALLLLFAPQAFTTGYRDLVAWAQRALPTAAAALRSRATPWIAAVSAIVLVGVRGAALGPAFPQMIWFALLFGWGGVMVLGILALFRARRLPDRPIVSLRPRSWGHWALVVIVVLSAAGPYLGLRTTVSFTMFSNLRTEQGVSNHLFLPRLTVFDLQDDFVEIVDTTDSRLLRAIEEGELVHELELRRRLALDPDQPIHFRRNGVDVELERAAERPELVTVGWLEAKLLRYRNLAISGHQACRGF